jgi:hypothetical protein
VRFFPRPLLASSTSPGSASDRALKKTARFGLEGDKLAELEVVATVITTAAELLPGVTELGVKLQSAAITGVLEQDRVTALVNEAPTGRTLKL